jgi:hypothetical protein
MKNVLIGLWICSTLLLLTYVAALSYDTRVIETCDKLAILSANNDYKENEQLKGYALRFPVY